eukprot:GEMP01075714.1.p1 GENE.GEMP01075714.1~~GEMP01075714.1.p1  ORF type:complete len:218 (+),score=44.58 GEMP01075714.1:30-656(+)
MTAAKVVGAVVATGSPLAAYWYCNSFPATGSTSKADASVKLPVARYAIDAEASNLVFKIRHLSFHDVQGRFKNVSGEIYLQGHEMNFARATVESGSVDTGNRIRDWNLKGSGLLSANDFPLMHFSSTRWRPMDDQFEVEGNLEICGTSAPVTFDVSIGDHEGGAILLRARAVLDRQQWPKMCEAFPHEAIGRRITCDLQVIARRISGQ